MRLGKASAFGIFATLYVAEHGQKQPVHGRPIARAYGIPAAYLLKILQRLVRSRVLDRERGRNGGFVLRKPADQTTLLEIVEAIDGPVHGELDGAAATRVAPDVIEAVERLWHDSADHARELLRRTTIDRLMSRTDPCTQVAARSHRRQRSVGFADTTRKSGPANAS